MVLLQWTVLTEGAPLSYQQSSLADGAIAMLVVVILALGLAYRMAFLQATFSTGGTASHESRVNCPTCGARTTTDSGACDYCEEPLGSERSSSDE